MEHSYCEASSHSAIQEISLIL